MAPCARLFVALLLTVAAVPLLAFALRSLRASGRSLRLLVRVGRARSTGFDEVTAGPVALVGEALVIQPLTSEETGRRGVYLAYSADRWTAGGAIGTADGRWLRAAQREEAAPFELTDGRSALLVDPRGAQILRAPGVSLELGQPGGGVVRYHEAMLEEHSTLVVVGHAAAHGGFDPSEAYRGHSYRLTITDGGTGDLVIAPPAGLRRAILAQALACGAGVLPALATLWLLKALLLPLLVGGGCW